MKYPTVNYHTDTADVEFL